VYFRRPIPLHDKGTAVALRARVDRVDKGQKVHITGEIVHGETGEVYGTARGLWIRLGEAAGNPPRPRASSIPPTVPVGRVPMRPAPGAPPHTAWGAQLLGSDPRWELDNARIAKFAYEGGPFRYYLHSTRLRRDLLWQRGTGEFVVAVAFSQHCQGPPGRVHGGCQFAVLDDALTVYLYGRGVSDLGPSCVLPRPPPPPPCASTRLVG
jgi:hypothetical protein